MVQLRLESRSLNLNSLLFSLLYDTLIWGQTSSQFLMETKQLKLNISVNSNWNRYAFWAGWWWYSVQWNLLINDSVKTIPPPVFITIFKLLSYSFRMFIANKQTVCLFLLYLVFFWSQVHMNLFNDEIRIAHIYCI